MPGSEFCELPLEGLPGHRDGFAALEAFKQEPFQLLLLDPPTLLAKHVAHVLTDRMKTTEAGAFFNERSELRG